jgi:hypothetical protein
MIFSKCKSCATFHHIERRCITNNECETFIEQIEAAETTNAPNIHSVFETIQADMYQPNDDILKKDWFLN